MPLYEYSCDRCHKVFEVIQRFSDEPLMVHENCGGALERLISPPALQFKGTGWYVTDYGRNGKNSSPAPTKDSAAKTESKAEASSGEKKSESKPAPTGAKPA